jgi:hypothetical protein
MNKHITCTVWEKALANALEWWALDIVDGTERGNRIIGMDIFRVGDNGMDPKYANGKTSWCGKFAEALHRPQGFVGTLDSVGRCISYGTHNRECAMAGYHEFIAVPVVGSDLNPLDYQCMRVEDYHDMISGGDDSQGRDCFSPRDGRDLIPGRDILIHQSSKSRYHGHVMPLAGWCPELDTVTVIEGNSQSVGPQGNRREGVGFDHFIREDEYITHVVRLSENDFHGLVTFPNEDEFCGWYAAWQRAKRGKDSVFRSTYVPDQDAASPKRPMTKEEACLVDCVELWTMVCDHDPSCHVLDSVLDIVNELKKVATNGGES